MKINYCINYENFIKGDYYNDILKKKQILFIVRNIIFSACNLFWVNCIVQTVKRTCTVNIHKESKEWKKY